MVYPILEWLLRNAAGLKKRAYLARYLVKVEVPGEFMAEEQIGELHQQVGYTVGVYPEGYIMNNKMSQNTPKSGYRGVHLPN